MGIYDERFCLRPTALHPNTAPVNVETIEDDGGVVELENNQQEDEKQANEDRHQRGSPPAGSHLPILRIEGLENVS
jgi:hypothetical protein